MFNNIGSKIKSVASVLCWIGIIGSVISAFAMPNFFWGLVVVIAGSLTSWISSVILYGFGQLIENSDYMVYHIQNIPTKEKKADFGYPTQNTPPKDDIVKEASVNNVTVNQVKLTSNTTSKHQWRCVQCGILISEEICPYCGKKN